MATERTGLFRRQARADWIRLRTLIVLRWIAIFGQVGAITVAQQLYDLQLELWLCYLAVFASVIANLIAIFIFPENKRLTEREVAAMILFDIAQLSFLIYLTGGLHNPFALLILAPVTISATVLGLRYTIFLGTISMVLMTLVALYHLPLRTAEGFILRMPQVFVFGFWAAIMIGVVFISGYARRVSNEMHSMSEALLATQMALAREQKLTDLGGVVAAAAHELGTPLATIKLVSAELMDELEEKPDLLQDAKLIREQADRCREILHSMGRAGKEDKQLRSTPLSSLIREAGEPHMERGIDVLFDALPGPEGGSRQPVIRRHPEIIHGLRNLIQNAVDFAKTTVWVDLEWTRDEIRVLITDDGPGFPPQLIGRIGDPFVRSRRERQNAPERPEYEGMGLGLFIAKTLLERTKAQLEFFNAAEIAEAEHGEDTGAAVRVVWPRKVLEVDESEGSRALGENQRIQV